MKGCFSASVGVHLFPGLRFRQRSKRSTNKLSSLSSASAMPFTLAISLVFKSRVGLVKFKIRTISYIDKSAIWPKTGAYRNTKLTFPVSLSFSTLLKFSKSSKWKLANRAFRSILWLNLPRHSIIARSIWLLLRPGNRIFPV